MTDNVTFTSGANSTPPASTVVATDQIGGVHYQVLKIGLGADGSVTLLGIGQQADAASLPVVEAVPGAFSTFALTNIGTSPVQLTTSDVPATRGVQLKAANANGGTLYVGNSNGVTTIATPATAGLELGAGEGELFLVDNANKLWLIGSTTGLAVFVKVV